MDADRYQDQAAATAVYPPELAVLYPLLGLIGEVGELVVKVRDGLFPDGMPEGGILGQVRHRLWACEMEAIAAEALKKCLRDMPDFKLTAGERMAMDEARARLFHSVAGQTGVMKEAGDVGWYWAKLTQDLGFRLSEVMGAIVETLAFRKKANALHGSGDDR